MGIKNIPVIVEYQDKKKTISIDTEHKQYGYYDNRNDNIVTKQLLESKRPNIAEIELTLFENCDINCSFCFHDKKSTVGLDYQSMVSKIALASKFCNDRVDSVEFIQINIVGGELFQDRLIEQNYLDLYIQLCDLILQIEDVIHKEIKIVFVTNFLFSDYEKIEQMLEVINSHSERASLILSYDFHGRPTNKVYYKNIKALESVITSVNVVATSESIKAMMTIEDDFFDYLYETHNVYIDDYIPDVGFEYLIPKDSEMLTFYKFLKDKYPNVVNIKELLSNETNSMGCLSLNKLTIFPDNSTSNCKWYRYKPENFLTYDKEIEYNDNAPQMQRHLDHFNCLSCEFYSKCKFRCFTQWDYKHIDKHDMQGCWIKEFLKFYENG